MISEGRRHVPRSHITSAAPRVVLPPLTDHDALISIQATPQTQSPLAVAAGFHRAMVAATGDQVTGGSPRPRPRPPEISTCCGLDRPRRHRKAAGRPITGRSLHGRPSSCQLSRLSWPRAVACSRGPSSSRVALVPWTSGELTTHGDSVKRRGPLLGREVFASRWRSSHRCIVAMTRARRPLTPHSASTAARGESAPSRRPMSDRSSFS